jgi:HEAT repeat protein
MVLLEPAWGAEPTFKHKSLTRWLETYANAKPDSRAGRKSRTAILAIGTNAVPTLVEMVASNDVHRQQLAANVFGVLGPLGAPAIPALTNLLMGTDPVATVFAANSLGAIGVAALPALMDTLTNQNYNAAALAALALAALGTNATPAVPVFLQDLRNGDRSVRERAAEALGNLHLQPEVVVPALTNLLVERSVTARCLALGSLAKFQGSARPSVPVILPLLDDPDDAVRLSATNALNEIDAALLKPRPAPGRAQ